MRKTSGDIRRGNAGAYLSSVMPREGGASSNLRPLDSNSDVSGILDRPVKPGDDEEFCRVGKANRAHQCALRS